MAETSEELYNFFSDTYDIYLKIKYYSVLFEQVSGGKVEVASINELRGVLFHLYSYMDKTEDTREDHIQENYYDAKEHLYRAYFDVFSVLSGLLTDKINAYSTEYGIEVVGDVYPPYFEEVIPGMASISEQIAEIRSIRQHNKTPKLKVITNDEIIVLLYKWYKTLLSLTPFFSKKAQQAKKAKFWTKIYQIYVPIFCVILCIILSYLFLSK